MKYSLVKEKLIIELKIDQTPFLTGFSEIEYLHFSLKL